MTAQIALWLDSAVKLAALLALGALLAAPLRAAATAWSRHGRQRRRAARGDRP
jgi:hypothetical protein